MEPAATSWDKTTEALISFAHKASYESLSADVVHACKLRVIDAFASALGAYDNPTSVLARKVAARSRTDDEHAATVWGSNIKTTPEAAAFTNGVMVRLLDISDTYLGKSRGHPSDMISGILAVAQSVRADGKSVINAITLAQDGFTGPTAVFEGDGGLWEVIGHHDWPLPQNEHLITHTHLKCLPICYHGQSAVFAALDLRKSVAVNDIVEMRSDERLTALYPEAAPARVSVRTKAGQTRSAEVLYPRGHAKNPLSDADVLDKFHELTAAKLSQTQRAGVLDTLSQLERVDDVAAVIKKLSA